MLDNGGPLLDGDDDPKMRWVKVSPHELLEGIAELNMEERGYYMTMFFTMYARMGGMPFDEREGAKILRVDIRMYRRLRDRMVAMGKLYVDEGELKNARTEYEITEYARKIRRFKDAAAQRVAKRREQVGLAYKLAVVADEIGQTSPELLPNFSQTSPELLPEVPGSSRQKPKEINVCAAQKLREQELELEQDIEREEVKGASAPPSPQDEPKKFRATEGDALRCFEAWNATALKLGLAQARTLTPARSRSLKARLNEHGLGSWDTALANVGRSAFLQGKNDRNWRADFDFLVQATSYGKIVDGRYGNGAHAEPEAKKAEPATMPDWMWEAIKRQRENGY
jgi:uncharacterized protein YdaU (DUF1376 family)